MLSRALRCWSAILGAAMSQALHDSELVADEELVFDDPVGSTFMQRERRPDRMVREGEVLGGKYRVERIPGRAGLSAGASG